LHHSTTSRLLFRPPQLSHHQALRRSRLCETEILLPTIHLPPDVLVLDSCCPRGTYFIYAPTYGWIAERRVCNLVSSTTRNHQAHTIKFCYFDVSEVIVGSICLRFRRYHKMLTLIRTVTSKSVKCFPSSWSRIKSDALHPRNYCQSTSVREVERDYETKKVHNCHCFTSV
jgi:hypothetical protein